jgi:hypothetical protein
VETKEIAFRAKARDLLYEQVVKGVLFLSTTKCLGAMMIWLMMNVEKIQKSQKPALFITDNKEDHRPHNKNRRTANSNDEDGDGQELVSKELIKPLLPRHRVGVESKTEYRKSEAYESLSRPERSTSRQPRICSSPGGHATQVRRSQVSQR